MTINFLNTCAAVIVGDLIVIGTILYLEKRAERIRIDKLKRGIHP